MFNLTDLDLEKSIIGCGDGPASFNSEMSLQGKQVISLDPIYSYSSAQIRSRFEESFDTIFNQVSGNAAKYVWTCHSNIESLRQTRRYVLNLFISDYEKGLRDGRYVTGQLPKTTFNDKQFDLALCSHLLFLYSEQLDFDFHLSSILEMCRIAAEVRIFPLVDLNCNKSAHLPKIISELTQRGHHAAIEKAGYEFQRGGNEMLAVISK